jgi:hypothetical protein
MRGGGNYFALLVFFRGLIESVAIRSLNSFARWRVLLRMVVWN